MRYIIFFNSNVPLFYFYAVQSFRSLLINSSNLFRVDHRSLCIIFLKIRSEVSFMAL